MTSQTTNKVVIGLGAVLGAALICPSAGLRFNHTSSMPIGLWIDHPPGGHVYAVGDVVEVCPTVHAWERRYLAPGACPSSLEPMLKPVAAVAGDVVTVGPVGVTVNGKTVPDTAPMGHDSEGRPLQPYPAGRYTVAADQVWLLVPRPDSLDSRYLGPVPIRDIKGLASPLWVVAQ